MLRAAFLSATEKSETDTSRSELNEAWFVATAVAQRSSHSCVNVNPPCAQPSSRLRSSLRACGECAHRRARARSADDSFVPPELTRLKISTTSSMVCPSPAISAM